MESYQIDILNPKATKLLKDLADLKLISIKPSAENRFLKTIASIRKNAESIGTPSLEEITSEVEEVRSQRYAQKKK